MISQQQYNQYFLDWSKVVNNQIEILSLKIERLEKILKIKDMEVK